MPITVLLVNDHRLVSDALLDSLAKDPDVKVVGEAEDVSTAVNLVRTLAPDVVVVRIGSPGITGIDAISRLSAANGSRAKVIALSGQPDRGLVTGALRAGASGYVTKSSHATELIHAIRTVAAGQTYLCSEASDALVSAVHDNQDKRKALITDREREVLRLIAEGMRSPAISERLGISVGTVEVHRRNIMRKLALRSVADLTRYAIREGLVKG